MQHVMPLISRLTQGERGMIGFRLSSRVLILKGMLASIIYGVQAT
jgi:hypothetical protein